MNNKVTCRNRFFAIKNILDFFRPELKDLIQLIYDKIATDDENKNCDVDLLSSFNDMLSNMKKSVGI